MLEVATKNKPTEVSNQIILPPCTVTATMLFQYVTYATRKLFEVDYQLRQPL